jgi:EmrB/QacA subfamily drug resistance transporter
MRAMRRLVTAGVLTGTALAAMEATVVGAVMPTVVASLGGLEHYSWVFAAYLLTSTVTVPVWGKLSDLYGRRPLYQVGIVLFLGGSALCGLSTSMGQLVAFRAVQGIGAGALVPLGMTILGDIYTPAERARIQGLFSGVWGLASVVGPPLGGFVTEQMSWRWVFYLNIPFGLVAAAIIGFSLHEPKRSSRPSIDYRGAVLLTLALSWLLLGLAEARSAAGLLEPWRLLAFAAAAGCGVAFTIAERRAVEPIVPPALMSHPVVAVSVVCGLLTGAAMFGAISYVPLYAQAAFDAGATAAGATLTPLMLGWVSFSVIGGRLLLRVGFRPTVLAGQSLLTLGFMLLALRGPGSAPAWLYADLAVIGAGLGLTMLSMLIAVQQTVPRAQLGVATSLNQLARSLGGAVGVAVMGVILTAGVQDRLSGSADWTALATPEGRGVLVMALRAVFAASAFTAAIALAVAAFFWRPGHVVQPSKEECSPETGERLVAAEMATLTPDQEPQARS